MYARENRWEMMNQEEKFPFFFLKKMHKQIHSLNKYIQSVRTGFKRAICFATHHAVQKVTSCQPGLSFFDVGNLNGHSNSFVSRAPKGMFNSTTFCLLFFASFNYKRKRKLVAQIYIYIYTENSDELRRIKKKILLLLSNYYKRIANLLF